MNDRILVERILARYPHPRDALRTRYVFGWDIFVVPMDYAPYRTMAHMVLGTMFTNRCGCDFDPAELIALRARTISLDQREVPAWVIAVKRHVH